MPRRLIVVVALACLGSIGCRHAPPPPAERPWGQGYEDPRQGYMEPDHGWAYYWLLSHLLFQSPQPTYHVYQVPVGYPVTYRPWMPRVERTVTAPRPPSPSVTRSSGGFSSTAPQPTAPVHTATPTRSSGGFAPAAPHSQSRAAPTRSSGGFSSSPASPTRSSGGFSRRK